MGSCWNAEGLNGSFGWLVLPLLVDDDGDGDTGILQDMLPPRWLFSSKVTKPGACPMGNASGSGAK